MVKLRISDRVFETARMDGFFGVIRDSMPDFWGRRVIDRYAGLAEPPTRSFCQSAGFDYLMQGADDRTHEGSCARLAERMGVPGSSWPTWKEASRRPAWRTILARCGRGCSAACARWADRDEEGKALERARSPRRAGQQGVERCDRECFVHVVLPGEQEFVTARRYRVGTWRRRRGWPFCLRSCLTGTRGRGRT